MKLVKNAVTEANPDLRGRKHHFTIENAAPSVLEAMDIALVEAGWDNDTCPIYDENVSCGYWIDIEEVDCFKKAYKAAKAQITGKAPAVAVAPAAPVVEVYAMYATPKDSISLFSGEVHQITAVEPAIKGTKLSYNGITEEFEAGETIMIVENTADDAAAIIAANHANLVLDTATGAIAPAKKRRTTVRLLSHAGGKRTFRIHMDNGRVYLYTEGNAFAQIKMPGGHLADTHSEYALQRIRQAIADEYR